MFLIDAALVVSEATAREGPPLRLWGTLDRYKQLKAMSSARARTFGFTLQADRDLSIETSLSYVGSRSGGNLLRTSCSCASTVSHMSILFFNRVTI